MTQSCTARNTSFSAGAFVGKADEERLVLNVGDCEILVEFVDRPVFAKAHAKITRHRPKGGSTLVSTSRFGRVEARLRSVTDAVAVMEILTEMAAAAACRVALRSFHDGTACALDRDRTLVATGKATVAVHVMTADEIEDSRQETAAASICLAPTRNLVLFLTIVLADGAGKGSRNRAIKTLTAATGKL